MCYLGLVIIMDKLKILFWNINGLRPKIDKLQEFVIDNPIDLILIQKVKCGNPYNLKIANFFSYFTQPIVNNVCSSYGGTAISH